MHSLVVLLVELAEGGPVQQGVRLQQLEAAVEFLQRQLELPLRRPVGNVVAQGLSDVVATLVHRLAGHDGGSRHLLERFRVGPGLDELILERGNPVSFPILSPPFGALGTAASAAVMTLFSLRFRLGNFSSASVAHLVELRAKGSQTLGCLVLLLFVVRLDLVQLAVEEGEEVAFGRTDIVEILHSNIMLARRRSGGPGDSGEDSRT